MGAYAVSSVCFRKQSFAGALATAKKLGFSSVDLVGLRGLCEHVPINGTDADFAAAARVVNESGMRPASVNADPGSFDGADDIEAVHRRIDRIIAFAERTSTPLIVLPAGEKADQPIPEPQIEQMAEHVNRAAERARAAGVALAVEAPYFGRPLDTITRTEALVAALDPSVGLAFDTSHIEAADESVAEAWRRLSDRVAIVHLRDAVSGNVRRVIGAGRIDFGSFLGTLATERFAGDIVLELETRDSPYATKEEEVLAAVEILDGLRGGKQEQA